MMLRTRTHNTLAAKKRWWNGCRYKFTGRWESRKWRVFIVKVWWDWVAAFAVGGLSRVLESRSRHWGAQNIFKARERWGYNTWIKPILTPGSLPALPKRLTFIEWQKDMGCILGHVTWQLGKIYSSWGCYCCAKSLQFSSVQFSRSVVSDSLRLQSCPNLCHNSDCSPPGLSVHGILQARILEWIAMLSSRGLSWPRGRSCLLYCRQNFFYHLSH